MRCHPALILACAWTMLAPRFANAATFCVHDEAELVAALATAVANAQADDIRIASITIALTDGVQATTKEDYALTLSGGWSSGCSRDHVGTTIIDGGSQHFVLLLYANSFAPVTVRSITLANGYSAQPGAALYLVSSGSVLVESSRFILSRSTFCCGGVELASPASVVFRNNLVLGNEAENFGAGEIVALGEVTINGNTFVFNSATSAFPIGGLHIAAGSSPVMLANNLIWFNESIDLYNDATNVHLFSNDIGVADGQPWAGDSTGNFHIEPVFAPGLFNFHLDPRSDLVNAGLDAPPGGLGDDDVDGQRRRFGTHVDIGADETDVFLRDGFDGGPMPIDEPA